MWRNSIISSESFISKAIEIIDKSGLQIALVVNRDGQLQGTVTDGDIRRAILKHLSLDEPVIKAMNPAPAYIYHDKSRETAILLMKSRKIHHLPVLDENMRVVGLEVSFITEETLAYVMSRERSCDIDNDWDFLYCSFLKSQNELNGFFKQGDYYDL